MVAKQSLVWLLIQFVLIGFLSAAQSVGAIDIWAATQCFLNSDNHKENIRGSTEVKQLLLTHKEEMKQVGEPHANAHTSISQDASK